MGDLKLTSASGSVTLSPENVAGTTTITVPSSTATLLTTDGDGSSLTGVGGDLSFGGDTFGADKTIGSNDNYALSFETNATERLKLTNDGRGLSQFTAKAWVNFNGSGTLAVNDSHNVSSVTDHEAGNYSVNFSNNMANANFSSTITAGNRETTQADSYMAASLYDTASGQSVSKQQFRTLRLKTGFSFQDPKTVCATFFGD